VQLISVVIPAYNAAPFIAETIGTVLKQSCARWELIVVDDGSTDDTEAVVRPFLSDARIRYVKQANAGVSAARNHGARLAKGEFLAFLDADDLWDERYLEKKLDYLARHPDAGMVVGNIRVMDRQGKPQLVFYLGIGGPDTIAQTVEFYDRHSAHPSNIFCRRADFDKTNGFNIELSNSADKMFYIDFARVSTIATMGEIMVHYRVHPQNMHRNIDLMVRDFLIFFRILKENGVFADKRQEQLCEVKILRICAGGCLQKRDMAGFTKYLWKAVLAHPAFMFRDLFGKTRFRNFSFNLLYRLGLGHLLMRLNRGAGKVPVLLFHRVTPEVDSLYPPIPPEDFHRVLAFFSQHYRFISVDELLQKPAAELAHSCCVVFDDGFGDFREFAVPILQELNVPVTLFLPAENIRRHEVIWTSQLDNCISHTKASSFTLETDGRKETFDLRSPGARIRSAVRLKHILMKAGPEEFGRIFSALKQQLGYEAELGANLLSPEQLNALPAFVSIQSHTLTHSYLPSLGEAAITRELEESKKLLETMTGKTPKYLSYPIGGYDQRVLRIAAAHYDASFAVDNRQLKLKQRDDPAYRQRLPRYNVQNHNPREVFFRVNGFHRLFGR